MPGTLAKAPEALLHRILELHDSGFNAEQIATRILTPDLDTAAFRLGLLVEIVLRYAHQHCEQRNE